MRIGLFLLAVLAGISTIANGAERYWNQFRGPMGDGVSAAKNLPVQFDEARNVRWKIAIPGEGWSSPVVWGDEIWLTSGSDDAKELRAICVDLKSGKIVKNIKVFDMIDRQVVAAYKFDSPHLNSPATPTPVVEDDRVFVHFGSQGIACLNRKTGEKVWERRDLRIYQPVRQGSSPIVDDKSLYVAYDGIDKQFFIALDKATGETRWKRDRNVDTDWEATLRSRGFSPKKGGKPNDNKKAFATATLIHVEGRRQLIAPAAEATIAYDPESGEELWRVLHPGGFNVAARPLYAHGLVYVFTSGLTDDLLAIRPNGRGDVTDTHIAWSANRGTPRIPSPIIRDDFLFLVTDRGGIARCLNAITGEEAWKKRIGGDHWASPLYADGKLYFCSKQGEVTVLGASRDEPEILARNELNARFIASPAVAGSSLILRSTSHLYCLANGFQRTAEQVAADAMPDGKKSVAVKDAKKKATGKDVDWDAAYAKLLKNNPDIRKKVESGGATKQQVIAWMKAKVGARSKGDNSKKGKNEGRADFYAIVIGRLKSKDVELGEFSLAVEHVTSMYGNRWIKDEIVGKTVNVTGVSGAFRDNLLLIRRGQTLKFRSGSYDAKSKTVHFGAKFHVLERTPAFKPADYGVPPQEFRGFEGVLQGKIVEVGGYEVLMTVDQVVDVAKRSEAKNAKSIEGKRIRVVGFYNEHADAFKDLHAGDLIRVSAAHRNASHDELQVTKVLQKVGGEQ